MFKPRYKQLINVDSSLSTCAKASLSLQHNRFVRVFSHRIFSSASETWYRYGSALLPRSTLLATLLCFASYEQCSTDLLKVLHKCCNTDVLGVLLIYPHSPLGVARPRDRAYNYISQTPCCRVTIYNELLVSNRIMMMIVYLFQAVGTRVSDEANFDRWLASLRSLELPAQPYKIKASANLIN